MPQQQFDRFEALPPELRLATYACCFEWAEEVNCNLLPRPRLLTSQFDPAEDPEDLVPEDYAGGLSPEELIIAANHAEIFIGSHDDDENGLTRVFSYCTLLPTIYEYLKTPAILRASRQMNIEATEVLNRAGHEAALRSVRFLIQRISSPLQIDDDNHTYQYNDKIGTYQDLRTVWRSYEQSTGTYSAFCLRLPDRPFRQWETAFWLNTIHALIFDIGQGRKFQIRFGSDCDKPGCIGEPLMATFDNFEELKNVIEEAGGLRVQMPQPPASRSRFWALALLIKEGDFELIDNEVSLNCEECGLFNKVIVEFVMRSG